MATFVWAAAVAGNWSTGANWQVGGVVQAAPPTAADDAVFGSGTGFTQSNCTVDAGAVCRSLDCGIADYTGTMTISNSATALKVGDASGGAFRLSTAMTVTIGGNTSLIQFLSTANNGGAGWNITTGGKSVPSMTFNGVGGGWTIVGTLTIAQTAGVGTLRLDAGSLTATSITINLSGTLQFGSNSNVRAFIITNSTINFNNTAAATIINLANITNATISATGSTLVVNAASANARTMQFGTSGTTAGNTTWGTLTYNVAGSTGQLNISTSVIFATINFSDATNARTLQLTAGINLQFRDLNGSGTSGKLMTYKSSVGGTPSTMTKTGNGLLSVDFVSVQDITAAGIINFFAGANSTNVSGNTNWTFTIPPVVIYTNTRPYSGKRQPYIHRGRTIPGPFPPPPPPPVIISTGNSNLQRRAYRGYPPPRGRTFSPFLKQFNPPYPFQGNSSTARTHRGRPPARGHSSQPPWPQRNPPFPHALIRATRRSPRLRVIGHITQHVPSQVPSDIGLVIEPTRGYLADSGLRTGRLSDSGRKRGVLTS